MAHSLGYSTDNNRQPDREERSREKQRGSRCGSWDEEAPRLPKRDLYIKLAQYNNLFNTEEIFLDKGGLTFFCSKNHKNFSDSW